MRFLLEGALILLRNSEEFGSNHSVRTRFESPEMNAFIDANMMKQVFWNLAKNSIKATPGGGTLTVSVSRDGASSVVVSFADDGVGMSESEMRRAFEPFQTNFSEGTGLGLAVVFRIVEEHRGRIRVRSRLGKGTEVLVTLPAAPGIVMAGEIAGAAEAAS